MAVSNPIYNEHIFHCLTVGIKLFDVLPHSQNLCLEGEPCSESLTKRVDIEGLGVQNYGPGKYV